MEEARIIVVAVRDEENGQIALQRALRLAQSPQDRFTSCMCRVWPACSAHLPTAYRHAGSAADVDAR